MKNTIIVLFITIFMFSSQIYAQNQNSEILKNDKTSLGFGLGLDHGGVGGNVLIYPTKNLGIFGGIGYAFAGIGYNAGIKIRFVSDNPKSGYIPYIMGMYGYNAVIHIKDATNFDKFFYGPSVGIGLDIRPGDPNKNSYWSLALLYPARSSEVNDYRDDLENNHNVKFETDFIPIAFSVSYRLVFNYFGN